MIDKAKVLIKRLRLVIACGGSLRSVLMLVSGTALAQLVVVLSTPILSRIYTPEAFGALSVFVSVAGVLSVVACLRYELAIPLPSEEDEAKGLYLLSLVTLLLFTLMLALAVFFGAGHLTRVDGVEFSELWYLVPVSVLLLGLYSASSYLAVRRRAFKQVARSKVSQSVVMVVIQLTSSVLGAPALVLGQVAGQAAAVGSVLYSACAEIVKYARGARPSTLIALAKKYHRYPLYSTWAGLTNSVGMYAPNVIFLYLFGPAFAGVYFMAYKIMSLPMQLLGQSVGQVFISRAGEAQRSGSLRLYSLKTAGGLLGIIFFPMLVVGLYGEELFRFLLGSNWADAGRVAQWLTLSITVQFIASPIGQILAVNDRQRLGLVLQVFLLVLRMSGIYIGAMLWGFWGAVAMFSIMGAVGYVVFLVVSLVYAGSEDE